MSTRTSYILYIFFSCLFFSCGEQEKKDVEKPVAAEEKKSAQLQSWASKPQKEILDWLNKVTDSTSSDFIPVKDRIAVFDNDGTLWPEQPWPNQLQFAFDYIRAKKDDHPEWQKDQFLKEISEGNYSGLSKAGVPGVFKAVNASHTAMSEKEFSEAVRKWLDTATNQKFNKKYDALVYQPMLELLELLREHDFKTFIVSGGGADFMRVFTEEVYGIPPYQVIGSYGEVDFEIKDGEPVINKIEGDVYFDDKEAKPKAIHRFIGKRPVFVGGNSDGDQAMMEYASASNYNTMCVLLYHTDDDREYAYDTKTLSGHLETALEKAKEKNWLVINMKEDFLKIF
ncbi:phosphoserine phosphatase [Christiangramia gaetbulicola]|uniref:Phosphoserine phosphatase n=1 Tax=Christiangramia gaetbulicola TaxID=703340 RepID=A0A2T6AM25_9FLAO|nr:HAD family hydrolase [Christiangramia gaetbulicola]PTX44868.1 phosphoserine phosphatase [Christiangramia gaetbulicola]